MIYNIIDEGQSSKKFTISRSFLYQLLTFTKSVFNTKGELEIEKLHKINSKIHYHFARRDVNAQEINNYTLKFKTDLANFFFETNTETKKKWYYNFQIPASIVLLKTRNLTNKE